MFPSGDDPKGDPETWTHEELRRWLAAVSRHFVAFGITSAKIFIIIQRDLHPQAGDTREQLLERVKANLRIPRRTNP